MSHYRRSAFQNPVDPKQAEQPQISQYYAPYQKSYGGMTGYISNIFNRKTDDGVPMINPYRGTQIQQLQSEAYSGLPGVRSQPVVASTDFNHVPRHFIRNAHFKMPQNGHHNRGPFMAIGSMKDSNESRMGAGIVGNAYKDQRINVNPDGSSRPEFSVYDDPYTEDVTRKEGRTRSIQEGIDMRDARDAAYAFPVRHRNKAESALLALKARSGFVEHESVRESVRQLSDRANARMDMLFKEFQVDKLMEKVGKKFNVDESGVSLGLFLKSLTDDGGVRGDMQTIFKQHFGSDYKQQLKVLRQNGKEIQKMLEEESRIRDTPEYHYTYGEEDPVAQILQNNVNQFNMLRLMSGFKATFTKIKIPQRKNIQFARPEDPTNVELGTDIAQSEPPIPPVTHIPLHLLKRNEILRAQSEPIPEERVSLERVSLEHVSLEPELQVAIDDVMGLIQSVVLADGNLDPSELRGIFEVMASFDAAQQDA